MDALKELLGLNNSISLDINVILSVLFFTLILSLYEFVIYRYISKRTVYNKELNISIITLPFFISTIILALQSNLVITLGTIGALAIIRYRTAIKDPINMTYILWAVHTGIVCGCQLYELGLITSLFASIVIYVLEKIKSKDNQSILCIKSSSNIEEDLIKVLKDNVKNFDIKTRSFANNNFDYIVFIRIFEPSTIIDKLTSLKDCVQVSLMECYKD
ncbi:MAG: DUF4956 domain-containing protein [Bdellovibrionota bacterium]|nr:DUF4956 domain-containing protein [Pseudomonadota bacterium]MDY6090767.1 DUF4956 domain-containing protein [Bdellovibrionota bacterium]